MVEQRALGEVGLSSREIAGVDGVAVRVSLKIAYARGLTLWAGCVYPAKALVANTTRVGAGRSVRQPWRSRSPAAIPGPSARVADGRDPDA